MVFSMTNSESGNYVHAYVRSPDGTLAIGTALPTGGIGTGHGLENQGALALSQDNRHLYVVNPGSNDLSVFRMNGTDLQLADRVPTGGTLPVSVAEWNGIVYVLNRHSSPDPGTGPSIAGFRLSNTGTLTAIIGSSITLSSSNTNAAQIGISPDGHWIIVTERGIDQIDVIPLSEDDTPGTPHTVVSAGHGPFGFSFSDALRLYIAESAGGSTSAYDINLRGSISVLAAALPTGQGATCWLAISPDNQWIYVTNTSSKSISSYRIARDGGLTLAASIAATTAAPPIDVVVDTTGESLSVLTTDGALETFRIDRTSGSLSSIQTLTGLPTGSNGLAGN
jgi:DNA-binding beta-propeller fold protein YncE